MRPGGSRPHCDPSGDRVEALTDEVVMPDDGGLLSEPCVFSIGFLVAIRGAAKHKELIVENHRERREEWKLSIALFRGSELILSVFGLG